jgi:hypothetical protein
MTEHNPFPMPFILTADDTARKIARIIESKKSFAVIPWQMAIVARVLRLLPNFLYDWLFANAPRKPRINHTGGRDASIEGKTGAKRSLARTGRD